MEVWKYLMLVCDNSSVYCLFVIKGDVIEKFEKKKEWEKNC